VLITDPDWTTTDDVTLWHAAQGGADGAAAELRKREANARTAALSPAVKATMAYRARNGLPR